jgi:hypothetical protein
MRSSIRNALKGISAGIPVNNQPRPDPIQTQSSFYRGNPTSVGVTTLGDYRMNNAIYEGMDLPPIKVDEHKPKSVTFQTDGNNVYQPTNTDASTASLIAKLGDQKFKYGRNDPYAKYMAYNKLERDLKEAEKNASFTDLTAVREIVRDAVEKRRTQNEQDFLRKMLDSGLSMEDAKDEIENVRRSNNLKEANMVDDRNYQSKMALKAFANRRGITTSIEEPLTHSGAINNPQMNEVMAKAAGMPERAFGNSPLDIERLAKTPGFYKRFLRKSGLSQEQADRDAAYNNIISQGDVELSSIAQLPSMERETNIMNMRENVAMNLDRLRNNKEKNVTILPPPLFATELVDKFYGFLNKKPGDKIRTRYIEFSKLNIPQLLFTINFLTNKYNLASKLSSFLKELEKNNGFSPNIVKSKLARVATELTPEGSSGAKLPLLEGVTGSDIPISTEQIRTFASSFVKAPIANISSSINRYQQQLSEIDSFFNSANNLSANANAQNLPTPETEGVGGLSRGQMTLPQIQERRRNELVGSQTSVAVANNQLVQPVVTAAVSANNEYAAPDAKKELGSVAAKTAALGMMVDAAKNKKIRDAEVKDVMNSMLSQLETPAKKELGSITAKTASLGMMVNAVKTKKVQDAAAPGVPYTKKDLQQLTNKQKAAILEKAGLPIGKVNSESLEAKILANKLTK